MATNLMDQIKKDYESGKLNFIKADLESFILKNKQEIKQLKCDKTVSNKLGELSDEVAIKLYILQHRSINAVREIKEQLMEIEREKWIRGVNQGASPNAQEVAQEWAHLYSPGWRDYRVLCIIYVFERDREHYLKLLQDS